MWKYSCWIVLVYCVPPLCFCHLLSHVLLSAIVRRWPLVLTCTACDMLGWATRIRCSIVSGFTSVAVSGGVVTCLLDTMLNTMFTLLGQWRNSLAMAMFGCQEISIVVGSTILPFLKRHKLKICWRFVIPCRLVQYFFCLLLSRVLNKVQTVCCYWWRCRVST